MINTSTKSHSDSASSSTSFSISSSLPSKRKKEIEQHSSLNGEESWTTSTSTSASTLPPKPLLYNLNLIYEWFPDEDPLKITSSSSSLSPASPPRSPSPSLTLSSSSKKSTRPSLPTSNPFLSPPPFLTHVPNHLTLFHQKCPWLLAWSNPTQSLALCTETHLEIYLWSLTHPTLTFMHSTSLLDPKPPPTPPYPPSFSSKKKKPCLDPYPAWRKLTWSTDGQYLLLGATTFLHRRYHVFHVFNSHAQEVGTFKIPIQPTMPSTKHHREDTVSYSSTLVPKENEAEADEEEEEDENEDEDEDEGDEEVEFDPIMFLHMTPMLDKETTFPSYRCRYATLLGHVGIFDYLPSTSKVLIQAYFHLAPWLPWISACAFHVRTFTLYCTGPTLDAKKPSSSSNAKPFPFLALQLNQTITFMNEVSLDTSVLSSSSSSPSGSSSSSSTSSFPKMTSIITTANHLRTSLMDAWTWLASVPTFTHKKKKWKRSPSYSLFSPLSPLKKLKINWSTTYVHLEVSNDQTKLLAQFSTGAIEVYDLITQNCLIHFTPLQLQTWFHQDPLHWSTWWSSTFHTQLCLVLVTQSGHWYLLDVTSVLEKKDGSWPQRILEQEGGRGPDWSSIPFFCSFPMILIGHPDVPTHPSSSSSSSSSTTSTTTTTTSSTTTQRRPHPPSSSSSTVTSPTSIHWLTRTLTSLTNTLLWHFETEDSHPSHLHPKRNKLAHPFNSKHRRKEVGHYQLFHWEDQTPEHVLQRCLIHQQFEAALEVAHQFGLSTDLVFQKQWEVTVNHSMDFTNKKFNDLKNEVKDEEEEGEEEKEDTTNKKKTKKDGLKEISPTKRMETLDHRLGLDILNQIQNKHWVLDTCLQWMSSSRMEDIFYLIDHGLTLSRRLFDPHEPATLPFLVYHCQLHQLRQRCHVFHVLLQHRHVTMNSLASFRSTPLLISTCQLVMELNVDAIHTIFKEVPWLESYRCHIVNHIPTFIDPSVYVSLLPTLKSTRSASMSSSSSSSLSSTHTTTTPTASSSHWYLPYLSFLKDEDFQLDDQLVQPITDLIQWTQQRALIMDQETGHPNHVVQFLKYMMHPNETHPDGGLTALQPWYDQFIVYTTFLYTLIPLTHPLSVQLKFQTFLTWSLEMKLFCILKFFPNSLDIPVPSNLITHGILPLFQSLEDCLQVFKVFRSSSPFSTSAATTSSTSPSATILSLPIMPSTDLGHPASPSWDSFLRFLLTLTPFLKHSTLLFIKHTCEFLYQEETNELKNGWVTSTLFPTLQLLVDQLWQLANRHAENEAKTTQKDEEKEGNQGNLIIGETESLISSLKKLKAHTLALKVLLDEGMEMNYASIQALDAFQFLHLWLTHLQTSTDTHVYDTCMKLIDVGYLQPQEKQGDFLAMCYTRTLQLSMFQEAFSIAQHLPSASERLRLTLHWLTPLLEQKNYTTSLAGLKALPFPELLPSLARVQVCHTCEQNHIVIPSPKCSNLELFHALVPYVNEPMARELGQQLGLKSESLDLGIAKYTQNQVRAMELVQHFVIQANEGKWDHAKLAEQLLDVLEHQRSPNMVLEFLPFCFQYYGHHLMTTDVFQRIMELYLWATNAPTTIKTTKTPMKTSTYHHPGPKTDPHLPHQKHLAPFFNPHATFHDINAWCHSPSLHPPSTYSSSTDLVHLFNETQDLHTACLLLPCCPPNSLDVQFHSLQLFVYVHQAFDHPPPYPSFSTLDLLKTLQPPLPTHLSQLIHAITQLEHQSIHTLLNQVPNLDISQFLEDLTYQWSMMKEWVQNNQLLLIQQILRILKKEQELLPEILQCWWNYHGTTLDFSVPPLIDEWGSMLCQSDNLVSKNEVCQVLVSLFENDAAKHNQEYFYRFLAKLDEAYFEPHYLQRADLAKDILDPSWSCQFLITQCFQGNSDFFSALFQTYFLKHDPMDTLDRFSAFTDFFQRMNLLTPIPRLETVEFSHEMRLTLSSLQSLWILNGFLKSLKSRTLPPENTFLLITHLLPFMETKVVDVVQSDLFTFLKRNLKASYLSDYQVLLPLLPSPHFQSIVNAVSIFNTMPCDWLDVSIFQCTLSTLIMHALQSTSLTDFTFLQQSVTWDTMPLDEAFELALSQLTPMDLKNTLSRFQGTRYQTRVWHRCAQLNLEILTFPDLLTHCQWLSRQCMPNVFQTTVDITNLTNISSLEHLFDRWLKHCKSIQDHELRTYTVFHLLPYASHVTLWHHELDWFQSKNPIWFLNCLIQLKPKLTNEIELSLLSYLTSPPHILVFGLCASDTYLQSFAEAMLTPLPKETIENSMIFIHHDAFSMKYPEDVVQWYRSGLLRYSPKTYFEHGLGLHSSLWSHWSVQRISWKFNLSMHPKTTTWVFELTQEERMKYFIQRGIQD